MIGEFYALDLWGFQMFGVFLRDIPIPGDLGCHLKKGISYHVLP